MNVDNNSKDLEVRTASAQWAVKKARQIVNENSLQAKSLTQKVVKFTPEAKVLVEENIYLHKDLWTKVKKMLLQ
jgi:hypothetical protein